MKQEQNTDRTMTVKLHKDAARKIRVLAAEEDRGIGEIFKEALADWWAKKGLDVQRGELFPKEESTPASDVIP